MNETAVFPLKSRVLRTNTRCDEQGKVASQLENRTYSSEHPVQRGKVSVMSSISKQRRETTRMKCPKKTPPDAVHIDPKLVAQNLQTLSYALRIH